MAAAVKIEFDDGSRVISKTLDEGGLYGDQLKGCGRPSKFSLEEFYEIPRTADFIRRRGFRRVALQFPDPLLREAPEVLWNLQALLRLSSKEETGTASGDASVSVGVPSLEGRGSGDASTSEEGDDPLIFITGDTSYGNCCVDEVSAQHLRADAIVHYGRACLSPTAAGVPVLYVFGKSPLDVHHLAETIWGELLAPHGGESNSTQGTGSGGAAAVGPVLLLYDVIYAHAMPALLDLLDSRHSGGERRGGGGGGLHCGGRLVVGVPAPQEYSPEGALVTPGQGLTAPGLVASNTEARRGGCQQQVGGCRTKLSGMHGCGYEGVAVTPLPPGHEVSQAPKSECLGLQEDDRRLGQEEGSETQVGAGAGARAGTQAEEEGKAGERKVRDFMRIGGLGVPIGSEDELRRHRIAFVGGEGRQLSNILLRCSGCPMRARYDPARPTGERLFMEATRGNRDLKRRYYLVQRAREAGVVGIVVGTLGVRCYQAVVKSLRRLVEAEGRKAYVLAVGKVNVAKLANFAEVEVFCIVACAENSLLDSREFHVPVVTPLELEVALGRREWDGFYSTDFEDLTVPLLLTTSLGSSLGIGVKESDNCGQGRVEGGRGGTSNGSIAAEDSRDGEGKEEEGEGVEGEGDQPFYSLVSGTYKMKPGAPHRRAKPRRELTMSEGGEGRGELVGVGEKALVEWSSPAGDFLRGREYQGLEPRVGQTETRAATEGQTGIASDYGGI
ncbi:unnamed protein product [Discosporangium mesarthrocarpum]